MTSIIPCMAGDNFPFTIPDTSIAVIDDRLKVAFDACNSMASEAAENVMFASVKIDPYICTSILGMGVSAVGLMQVMHGIDLPPETVVPKAFTQAVAKVETPLVGFGLTWSQELGRATSVTVWFENGAWIKTQCYQDRWTDIKSITETANYPSPIPAGLFEAVEAIAKFSDDKEPNVYFGPDLVMSHPTTDVGSQYQVPGLVAGKRFNARIMKAIAPYCKAIDLTTFGDKAYFTGGEDKTPIRGVVMGMTGSVGAPVADPVAEPTGTAWGGAEITGDDGIDDEPDASEVNPHVGWGN